MDRAVFEDEAIIGHLKLDVYSLWKHLPFNEHNDSRTRFGSEDARLSLDYERGPWVTWVAEDFHNCYHRELLDSREIIPSFNTSVERATIYASLKYEHYLKSLSRTREAVKGAREW